MSESPVVWTWRVLAAVGGALVVVASIVLFILGEATLWWDWGTPFAAVFALFFAVLVWQVIGRQSGNTLLWVLAVSAFFWGVYAAGGAALAMTYPGDVTKMLADPHTAPVDLPRQAAWVMTLTSAGWLPALFPIVTLGLLLFPDGRLPSRRWRWAAGAIVTGIATSTVSTWVVYRPTSQIPYNDGTFEHPVLGILVVGGLVTVGISLAALVARFLHSRGETRQQFKWVVWGGSVFVVGVFAAFLFEGTRYQAFADSLFIGSGFAFVASYGIAVGKYRLYDVDVVISRTIVYGTLAVLITGVYVAAVLGVGELLGARNPRSNPWLAIGATALVAFAFEPLRGRLQRLANRLVYGRRATPYEVLSEFANRIGTDDEEMLGQVARSLVEGTTAVAASVWATVDGSLIQVAAWPQGHSGGMDSSQPPSGDVVRDAIHDGERLGVLALTPGRGQSILTTDERLLEQVASSLGLALRNLRLRSELRRQVEQLSRSRQRLLVVQDETRRQLERELHEGAQQRLVALKLKLGVARNQARESERDQVVELLDQVTADTERAVESLRDFARGVYPPLLEAEGLRAALTAQAQKLTLPVTVHAAGVGRFSPELEAAVYFCVLEAIQNVVKHAGATSAHVTIRQSGARLVFEVSDDGVGFDPAAVTRGSGLSGLADRLSAFDGTIDVVSHPGEGTTVRGQIALAMEEPVA